MESGASLPASQPASLPGCRRFQVPVLTRCPTPCVCPASSAPLPARSQVGQVHGTRFGEDDSKSLLQLSFQTGDYLDVAIH